MTTVFDIVRATPRNNCGECGFPTCMAFAVAVTAGQVETSRCPYLTALAGDGVPGPKKNVPSQSPDTTLLRELQAKVKSIDLAARAEGLGADSREQAEGVVMTLNYLGRVIRIRGTLIEDREGRELDPRDQILLYNYLFFQGSGPLSGEWVGLESFPNSISKVVTLRRYTEEKLASAFVGRGDHLQKVAQACGAKEVRPCHADVCLLLHVLPKVPLQIHFWDADQEDGFPVRVKVLFDRRAMDFLDIESLVFAAERTAETLIEEAGM